MDDDLGYPYDLGNLRMRKKQSFGDAPNWEPWNGEDPNRPAILLVKKQRDFLGDHQMNRKWWTSLMIGFVPDS